MKRLAETDIELILVCNALTFGALGDLCEKAMNEGFCLNEEAGLWALDEDYQIEAFPPGLEPSSFFLLLAQSNSKVAGLNFQKRFSDDMPAWSCCVDADMSAIRFSVREVFFRIQPEKLQLSEKAIYSWALQVLNLLPDELKPRLLYLGRELDDSESISDDELISKGFIEFESRYSSLRNAYQDFLAKENQYFG